jgi:hypothetical protein
VLGAAAGQELDLLAAGDAGATASVVAGVAFTADARRRLPRATEGN